MNRHALMIVLLEMILMLYTSFTNSAVINVPFEYPTIQAGINAAIDGDTVMVANDTYMGQGNRGLDFSGKQILLTSEGGAGLCTIDCGGEGRAFLFHSGESATSIVSGFTIIHGSASGENGAGILIRDASPCIANCIFTECGLSDNCLRGGGIASFDANPTLFNCLIFSNQAAIAGGGIYCQNGTPTFSNCTVVTNSSDGDGGGLFCTDSTLQIVNSIFRLNNAGTGYDIYLGTDSAPSTATLSYCDFNPYSPYVISDPNCTYTFSNNINADPCFVHGVYGDYYLLQDAPGSLLNSPCFNAGSDNSSAICIQTGSAQWFRDVPVVSYCMNQFTTRIDSVPDTNIVDIGFHYPIPPSPTPTPSRTYTLTPTLTHTRTPTRTRTPTPFYTPDPNATPTPVLTATETPVETPTSIFSPPTTALPTTPTSTATPTVGASHTPAPGTGTTLLMSDVHLNPGDHVIVSAALRNNNNYNYEARFWMALYVLGYYYWYPTWTMDIDYEDIPFFALSYEEKVILDFYFPSCEGSIYGLQFISGLTNRAEKDIFLIGEYSVIDFDYDCE